MSETRVTVARKNSVSRHDEEILKGSQNPKLLRVDLFGRSFGPNADAEGTRASPRQDCRILGELNLGQTWLPTDSPHPNRALY